MARFGSGVAWLRSVVTRSLFSVALACSVALLAPTLVHAQAGPAYGSRMRVDTQGDVTRLRLEMGTKSTSSPVHIFFISGSGCASIKSRLPDYFSPLADELTFTVHAQQKRGIGPEDRGWLCSATFYEHDHRERLIQDQLDFIAQEIKLIKEQQPKPILVLFGVSEGALIATAVASRIEDVNLLVTVGGGGASMRQNLIELDKVEGMAGGLETQLQRIALDPSSTSSVSLGHTFKYWSSMLNMNMSELLPAVRQPVLSAMGERDESVPVQPAIVLYESLAKAGKPVELVVFKNANHRLVDVSSNERYSSNLMKLLAERLAHPDARHTGVERYPQVVRDPVR